MVKINIERILSTQELEYIVDYKESRHPRAVKTKGFKGKFVKGRCALYYHSKCKPRVGKKYLVRVGDPFEFKATFIGEIMAEDLIKMMRSAGYPVEKSRGDEEFENSVYLHNSVVFPQYFVFRQGEEILISGRRLTEFVKRKRKYWFW